MLGIRMGGIVLLVRIGGYVAVIGNAVAPMMLEVIGKVYAPFVLMNIGRNLHIPT